MNWRRLSLLFLLTLLDLTLIVLAFLPMLFSYLVPPPHLNTTLIISKYTKILENIKVNYCPYPLTLTDYLCQLPDYKTLPEWRYSAISVATLFLIFNFSVLLIFLLHRSLRRGTFIALIIILILSLLMSIIFNISAYHIVEDVGIRIYEQVLGFCLHFKLLSFFLWINFHLFQVTFILILPTFQLPLGTYTVAICKLTLATLLALVIPSINLIFMGGYSILTFLPLPTTWYGFYYLMVFPLCILNASTLLTSTLLSVLVRRVKKSVGQGNALWYNPLTSYTVRMFLFFAVGSLLLDLTLSMSLIVKNHELIFNSSDSFYLAISIVYNSKVSVDSTMSYHKETSLKVLKLSFVPLLLWPVCLLCYELAFSWTTISKMISKWSERVSVCCRNTFSPLRSSEQQILSSSN